ncbi:efflux RND transporter periplasmic adaptor subunit [Paraburkholderia bryophila]|uniref:efflux RND transporter periplasmic adaptor subunit n=1 Tax=Paraburkholderia bryophila TaxID=420952 RepID=UPI00234A3EF7|nr:efflux RND transporter periplasmic adaptor subunit [Paraburkholderia bryophila]WCM23652.1 efflux RND transporter periplasmic adaptor subunit [Paraburkholderia bryophila]
MRTHSQPTAGFIVLAAVASVLALSACTKSATQVAEPPKPVKTEVVGAEKALASTDSFVGTLRARQRSDLSFEAAGRVVAILVDVGDRVRAGQVLARLDESPARWRLNKAEADRAAAAATVVERRTQLQQQEALALDKIISQTALESARAAGQLAQSQLATADAALATARRDLAFTHITAPFDGEIVARLTQPFSDAAPGQAILQIQAGNALEVVAMLPDSIAATLSSGASAQGKSDTESFPITLERLSARSDNGSLVQAIFHVPQSGAASKHLRSGGVVSVELPNRNALNAITVPAPAVMWGDKPGQATVFVMDQAGKLQRRTVQAGTAVQPAGRVTVSQGLTAGDRVVVAGTAFLHEGQLAHAQPTQTLLQGTTEGAAQ